MTVEMLEKINDALAVVLADVLDDLDPDGADALLDDATHAVADLVDRRTGRIT